MSNLDFQNGLALGLAMGGVIDASDNKSEIAIQYVESTGTQYVNTGYIANQNTRIECKYQIIGYNGAYDTLFSDFTNIQYSHRYEGKQIVKWGGQYTTFGNAVSSSGVVVLTVDNGTFTFNDNNTVTTKVVGVNTEFVSPSSILLFANRYYKDVSQYELATCCKTRLFYFKIYEGETLVRDFTPDIDEHNIVCLYDNVTKTYFYNQGTGEFVGNFIQVEGKEEQEKTITITENGTTEILPDDDKTLSKVTVITDISSGGTETVVEYIESTGTQYIDTEYVPTNNTKIVADLIITEIPNSTSLSLCGCVNSSNNGIKLPFSDSSYSDKAILYSKWGDTLYHIANSPDYLALNALYHIEFSLNGLYLDKSRLQYKSGATFPSGFSQSLYIFGLNNNGKTEQLSKIQLYSFKVYEGETLVRDFIPAIDEDGAICLYDNVTQEYFYNQGTGDFVGGFVESELVNIENLIDESGVLDSAEGTVISKVEQLIEKAKSGGSATIDESGIVYLNGSIDGRGIVTL